MTQKTVAHILKKYGVKPNKKLGQNFLSDFNLMDKMIDHLNLYPDEDVLEIGSGLGVLTNRIAMQGLEVIAIEKDKRLHSIAKKEFQKQANIKFIETDFLKTDLLALVQHLHLPIKIIGNIAYNISSPILFKLLEHRNLFSIAILTLQKEVAKRLVAHHGNKDYGILTILMNIYTQCEILFDIEAGSFLPPPKVTSTVVKITSLKKPKYVIYDYPLFQTVVKQAFKGRRKTIKNTLKVLLKNGRIKPWDECQIDPSLRPEQISIAEYVVLANYLHPLL